MSSGLSSGRNSDDDKCREKRLQCFVATPTKVENIDTTDRTEDMVVAAKHDDIKSAEMVLSEVHTRHGPGLLLILAHEAASRCSLKCLKMAIERGVNVNAFDDKEGWRLIHWAAGYGQVDCIKLLLKHGAKVNDRTRCWNFTALYLAAVKGHLTCVRLLLQHGADTAAADKDGDTALSEAAANGRVDCVRELLLRGADVNSLGWRARTPLHVAARNGHMDCFRALLQHRANSQLRDNDNKTAFQLLPSELERTAVEILRNAAPRRTAQARAPRQPRPSHAEPGPPSASRWVGFALWPNDLRRRNVTPRW